MPGQGLSPAGRPRAAGGAGGVCPRDRIPGLGGSFRRAGRAGATAAARISRRDGVSPNRLEFATTGATEFVDITPRIRDEVRRTGLRNGRVHLQSLHTTLGLAVNENEPLLLRDFEG
ncbi:MAG: hypothetical protein E6I72_00160, partial [Chloroflexi bacterium]